MRAAVYLRVDGCGGIEFDSPRLEKAGSKYPADVILAPAALLDSAFALSQHDPAVLTFYWKREVAKEKWNLKDPELHVMLPEGIMFREACDPLTFMEKRNGADVFSLRSVCGRPVKYSGYDRYLCLPLLLTTDAAPGSVFSSAQYWLEDGGKPVSEKKSFRFLVIPQIPDAGKSRLFLNGFQLMGRYLAFKQRANKELWARSIGRTGFRWLSPQPAPDPEMRKLSRRYGIVMITPELYWIANGCRIGSAESKPEYAKFRAIAKSDNFDVKNGTCPAAVYNRTPYFKKGPRPLYQRKSSGHGRHDRQLGAVHVPRHGLFLRPVPRRIRRLG